MSYFKKCLIAGAAIIAVAVLGSVFTNLGQQWFETLAKPAQWSPDFIFPIVWSAIYIITFFAICSALKAEKLPLRLVIIAAINGALNVLWCLLFFTLKQTFLGEVFIIFNLAAAIFLIAEFYKLKSVWFYPMLIYPLWIGIATALNSAIWILQ